MCLIATQFILASKIYTRTQLSSSVAVFVVLSKADVVSLQVLNIFHALSLSVRACVRACVCVSVCVVMFVIMYYIVSFRIWLLLSGKWGSWLLCLFCHWLYIGLLSFTLCFLACSVCYYCLIFIVTITGPLLVFCALVLVFLTSKTKKVCFEKNRILLCPLVW